MSVEAQNIWQMFVIDHRKKTHQQKAEETEKMEKVVKENRKVVKMEKRRLNNWLKFRIQATMKRN